MDSYQQPLFFSPNERNAQRPSAKHTRDCERIGSAPRWTIGILGDVAGGRRWHGDGWMPSPSIRTNRTLHIQDKHILVGGSNPPFRKTWKSQSNRIIVPNRWKVIKFHGSKPPTSIILIQQIYQNQLNHSWETSKDLTSANTWETNPPSHPWWSAHYRRAAGPSSDPPKRLWSPWISRDLSLAGKKYQGIQVF